MSGVGGKCLLCSSDIVTENGRRGGGVLDRPQRLYNMTFLFHKLLQIPLLNGMKYAMEEESLTPQTQLCDLCSQMVEEGRELVEQLERLELKLQTVQATLQNQLLQNTGGDHPQAQLRNRVTDEIRTNLNSVLHQPTCPSRSKSVPPDPPMASSTEGSGGALNIPNNSDTQGDRGREDRVIGDGRSDTNENNQGNNVANSVTSPYLEEEEQEEEVIAIKSEIEQTEDPLTEVIDLVDSDTEEHGENGRNAAAQLDEVVTQIMTGGPVSDVAVFSGTINTMPNMCSTTPYVPPSSPLSPYNDSQRNKRGYPLVGHGTSDGPPVSIARVGNFHSGSPVSSPQGQDFSRMSNNQLLHQLLRNGPTIPPPNGTLRPAPPPPYPTNPQRPPSSNSTIPQLNNPYEAKKMVWNGMLEWNEKRVERLPHSNATATYRVPVCAQCRIYSPTFNHIPLVSTTNWPTKLIMQLMPKYWLISNDGASSAFLREAYHVQFEFDCPNTPELSTLKAKMDSGLVGCIHVQQPGQSCNTQVLVLVHVQRVGVYFGLIPHRQNDFVSLLREITGNYRRRQAQILQQQQQWIM